MFHMYMCAYDLTGGLTGHSPVEVWVKPRSRARSYWMLCGQSLLAAGEYTVHAAFGHLCCLWAHIEGALASASPSVCP